MRRWLGIRALAAGLSACLALIGCSGGEQSVPLARAPIGLNPTDRAASPVDTQPAAASKPAPPTTSAPAAPTEPAGPKQPVVAQIEALLSEPELAGRKIAVSITDNAGEPVLELYGGSALVPASTQKLVTAAAGLRALGGDFRYVTRLHATVPPDAEGVVHGSLVLVGAGDPALGTPEFGTVVPDRPRTPIEALADQVAASGIRRITGHVLGDASVFPNEPVPAGWLPRYVSGGDGTRSSGLTVNGGRRLYHENGQLRSDPAEVPATEAAVSLRALLIARGVAVDGAAGATDDVPEAPVAVGAVASPPMREILRYLVQRSDNGFADAVFRTVGLHASRHSSLEGDASWKGSARAVKDVLGPLALDWDRVELADGSGLSRNNRMPPKFLTALGAAMMSGKAGAQAAGEWPHLLALAGHSGTLRSRLAGSLAQGRVFGKTGTLRDVRALAGTVVGPEGKYHFAVIGNALDQPGVDAVRRLQDRLALALAADLHGCFRHPAPGCP